MRDSYCQAPKCGTLRRPWDLVCPKCGCDVWGDTVPRGAETAAVVNLPLEGPLGRALGLPPGKVMLLHAVSGGGKSTIAMQGMPHAAVCTTEMDPPLIYQYRRDLGLPWAPVVTPSWQRLPTREDGSTVAVSDLDPSSRWAYIDLGVDEEKRHDLILDSASEWNDQLAIGRALVEYCRRTMARGILIVHQTADQRAWGGTKLPHLVHARVKIDYDAQGVAQVIVEKNRSGPTRATRFELRGKAIAVAQRYYSVEGRRGSYQLVEHPSRHAQYADIYKDWEKEKVELAAPPFALAARKSRQGSLGYVQPSDWEHRREFAEANGVPYYTPETAIVALGDD